MGRSTRRVVPAVAEAMAEGPDALGTVRLLVIVPEDARKQSGFAVSLRWEGELRFAQWVFAGTGKTTARRWLDDVTRDRGQAWPVPLGEVRTLLEAAQAREPSPVVAALLRFVAHEPAAAVASPAPRDAGLHPNEARAVLSEWPFRGRLVLSQGDLAVLGISLPAALDARALEAWAREASHRLDVPELRLRIERIARIGAFVLYHRGDAKLAGQLAAWAETARSGTHEHPVALALLRNTLMLEPDRVHEPSLRHDERTRLAAQVTSGHTVGDLVRVELGARLFAGVAAVLDHELLSERVPRYDVLRAIVGAVVERARREGAGAVASAAALGPFTPEVAEAEVAERIEAALRGGLRRFADEVAHDPAMAWAARDPGETLPSHWFTHGLPGRQS